jgi:hypothetical protein
MRAIAGFGIAYVLVLIGLAIGWVMNIVSIIHHINDPLTNMMILRWVGIIVAPLGGVVGWF